MARVSRKPHMGKPTQPAPFRTYRVAMYVRLSVEDVRKKISDSIGTQKALLMNFIQTQADMELYEVYEDLNYTGTNFNRPAFARMMEDIQDGRADCVIVKDLSRFGRSFEETGNYLERVFPFLGVRFVSVGDNYDSLTASLDESSLIVPLKNLINEIYARDISKKVVSGKRAKQQRGEFCGCIAPYGYIKKGTSFIVDEEAASIVQQIYQWVIDGLSDSAIAQKLNGMKISPPSRHLFEKGLTKTVKHEAKFWYPSAVKRISEYPAYTGVLVSGKYQSNFLRNGGATEKAKHEWIITEGAHPAIIDPGAFDAVQKIREVRRQNYKTGTKGSPNIFKGLIFCGDCGSHMTRKMAKAKHTFLCSVYATADKSACTHKPIREADLQAALYAYISREISLAVDMTRIITDVQKRASFRSNMTMLKMQIDALQIKLDKNRRFRGSLREDFHDGVLSKQEYDTMRTDYNNEKDKLQQELNVLIAGKRQQDTALSPENKWIAEFRGFETDQQLSAEMLSALVERIDVYDGARVEIKLRYRDEWKVLQDAVRGYEEKRGQRAI